MAEVLSGVPAEVCGWVLTSFPSVFMSALLDIEVMKLHSKRYTNCRRISAAHDVKLTAEISLEKIENPYQHSKLGDAAKSLRSVALDQYAVHTRLSIFSVSFRQWINENGHMLAGFCPSHMGSGRERLKNDKGDEIG